MGALVKAFDTRPVVREQVESLGAEYITVEGFEEDGSGAGGYAKEMSDAFLQAERDLLGRHAKESDIVISTALIPGRPAPRLLMQDAVEHMRPGSVIVDLAAETGGNCELTRKDELYTHANGVHLIGYTDLPSRLPTQSSTLYSNNITKLVLESLAAGKDTFRLDLEDEVIRRSLVTLEGELMWPAPAPPPPTPTPAATPEPAAAVPEMVALTPRQKVMRDVTTLSGWLAGALALGKTTTPVFMGNVFTMGLASLVGYRAVWSVTPALHSPLMSITNAISGLVGVGGMLIMGGGLVPETPAQVLGAASVLLATVNIAGGFEVTRRMLDLFRRPDDPPEHSNLYAIPALVYTGCFIAAASTGGIAGLIPAGYLVSSLLCVGALSGLSAQATARSGNALGMIGVWIGLLTTLAACSYPDTVLAQFGLVTAAGALIGLGIGRRVGAMQLPQTIAALHSVVGLAAVLTSIGSILGAAGHSLDPLHLATAYAGVLIGGITFTGSIVAFLKLAGRMASRPTVLPAPHLINTTLLTANVGTLGVFMTMAPSAPGIALACLLGNTAISCAQGWIATAAVGGADMRASFIPLREV